MIAQNNVPSLTRDTVGDEGALQQWLTAAREEGAVAFIDKPKDWTSFDCVAKLRNTVGIRRVGHAGTLDPLATGLLIVCFGRATKLVDTFQEQHKRYTVEVKLGARTATDDQGSEEVVSDVSVEPTSATITNTLQQFVGTITQIAPDYSAVKVGGVRQYDRARKGKPLIKVPRIVEIFTIDDVEVSYPMVSFSVECSKGTYVRSIARDLGEQLNTGGYVWELRRTAIGTYHVADAAPMSAAAEALAALTKEAA